MSDRWCKNCNEDVVTPDDRTGDIHSNGKYACYKLVNGKPVRMETVAE